MSEFTESATTGRVRAPAVALQAGGATRVPARPEASAPGVSSPDGVAHGAIDPTGPGRASGGIPPAGRAPGPFFCL